MASRLRTGLAWALLLGLGPWAVAWGDDALISRCEALLTEATQGDPVIPPDALYEAKAILIAPGVIDRQLVLGMRTGQGVLLTRQANGEWGAPEIMKFTGGSAGFAGRSVTDTIMLFNVPVTAEDAITRYKLNRLNVTIGLSVHIAGKWTSAVAEPGRDPADLVSTFERSRGMLVGAGMGLSKIDPVRSQRSWIPAVFASQPDTSARSDASPSPPTAAVSLLHSKLARVATAPKIEMAVLPVAPTE